MFPSLSLLAKRRLRPIIGFLLAALTILLLAALATFGQTAYAAGPNRAPLAQSGATATPAPGATNPLGSTVNYLAFRDDELFSIGPDAFHSYNDLNTYLPSTSLELGTPDFNNGTAAYSNDSPQLVGDRGRITTQDYDQVVYAGRNGNDIDLVMFDQSLSPSNPVLSTTLSNLAPRPGDENLTDLLAIAVGDLDQLQDSNGNNHDEVAVAYASPDGSNYQLNLVIEDYTDTTSGFSPSGSISATTAQEMDGSLTNIVQTDNMLSVAVGDIDGDGQNEIVVAYLQNATTLRLDTFRYSNNSSSDRTLTLETSTAIPQPTGYDYYTGTISLKIGDVNGDNVAELVVGYVGVRDISGATSHQAHGFSIYSANSTLDLTLDVAQVESYATIDHIVEAPRVEVALGMFKYDPSNGYDMGRNQIALAHNNPDYVLEIATWDVSTDLTSVSQLYSYSDIDISMSSSCPQCYSIVAGDFRGVDYSGGPQWDLAFQTFDLNDTNDALQVGLVDVISGKTENTAKPGNSVGYTNLRMPLVAYDYDGNSIFLGAPIHLQVDGQVTTDYILYEPPKHTFYVESYSTLIDTYTAGEIVNVSRFPDFDVTLTENSTSSVNTTKTQTSGWTIGSSVNASASQTIKESANAGIASESESITASIAAGLGYSHSASQEHTDSSYTSTSVTYSTTTNSDDSVGFTTQSLDIWRYRIYGATLPNGNPYYDYVIPGIATTNIGQEGTSLDWYQPQHENGNLLSYPIGSSDYTPSDIGALTTTSGTVTIPLVPATAVGCCGNSGQIALAYNSSIAKGSDISNSNTLTESVDVGLAYKSEVSAIGDSSTVKASVNVGVSNSNSWSTTQSKTNTTTVGDSITLQLSSESSSDESEAYTMYPVFYATQDGTFKVAHGINFDSDAGVGLWGNLYGVTPDAALNLPNRFYMNLGTTVPYWEPTTDDTRKTIRGFALLDGTIDPVTNQYDVLPDAPVSGAPIYVQFNVYNYSLGGIVNNIDTTLNNLDVLVQYAPFDGTEETGSRVTVGSTTVSDLTAMSMVPVSVPWDTTGLGGTDACDTQEYRVIVTLDPNNTISETYETEDSGTTYPYVIVDPVSGTVTPSTIPTGVDPGQNNEGYGYVTIQTPATSGDCDDGFDSDTYTSDDSLTGSSSLTATTTSSTAGIAKANKQNKANKQDKANKQNKPKKQKQAKPFTVTPSFREGKLRAPLNRPVQLKLKIYSDKPHGLFGHVMVYDGKPQQGKLIADKIVHFGSTRGAVTTFDWIPRTVGKHKLHAVILPFRDDPDKTNQTAKLKVVVPRLLHTTKNK